MTKSFRPISLMSFLLKAMERLILWFLLESKGIKLHKGQYAYQAGKSTVTALHHLVGNLEGAIQRGEFALSVLLDIEGAFNNTTFKSMEEAMERFAIPRLIQRWVSHMLRYRTAWTEINECKRERVVEKGCPQGGVLSPLLWVMVVDDLLVELSRHEKAIFTVGFSDDVTLTISGIDPPMMRQQMQGALNRVNEWCMKNDLKINPRKTESIMFTRKRKWSMKPLKLNGIELERKSKVKLLGVILDSKLTWRDHCQAVTRKCLITLGTVKRAVGKLWGLKPQQMEWIYKAIVRPMATYAAVVWTKATEVKLYMNWFEQVQRTACLMITGAMRTTPGRGMEYLIDIPPIREFIRKEALSQAIWLTDHGSWKPIRGVNQGSTHTSICQGMMDQMEILKMPRDGVTPRYNFKKKYSIHIGDGKEPKEKVNNSWELYTDGSKDEQGNTGLVVYAKSPREEESQW